MYAGFTLVEFLITFGIIVVISSVILFVVNPVELMREARDAGRVSGISEIERSIRIFKLQNPSAPLGQENKIYVSLPSPNSNCSGAGLPVAPSGFSYVCSTQSNYRRTDGTGWLPLSLAGTIGDVPADPINSGPKGYYFAFVTRGTTYYLSAGVESEEFKAKASADGGSFVTRLEFGTDPALAAIVAQPSLFGHWKFDELTGSNAFDSSVKNNTGVYSGTLVKKSGSDCRSNSCLLFNGSNSYVGNDVRLVDSYPFTMSAWIKTTAPAGHIFVLNAGIEPERGYTVRTENSKGVIAARRDSGTWYKTIGSINISDGALHHIVGVFASDTERKLYVDGIRDEVSTSNTSRGYIQSEINRWTIGRSRGVNISNEYFNGTIDDVRIYDIALTDGDILNLYNETLPY